MPPRSKPHKAACNETKSCTRTMVLSTVVGKSKFLFGDLSKLTKAITNANKLMKKMRPSQSTGCGDIYRAHSHRTHGSFASQRENRFHPRQYQGSKHLHFLAARIPSSKKKRKRSARSLSAIDTKVCEKLVMSSRMLSMPVFMLVDYATFSAVGRSLFRLEDTFHSPYCRNFER